MKEGIDYLKYLKGVRQGSVSLVNEFLKSGLDINYLYQNESVPSCHNKTALMIATKYGHEKICRQLLEAGASCDVGSIEEKISNPTINTPLLLALQSNNIELLRLLITHSKNQIKSINTNFLLHKNMTNDLLFLLIDKGIEFEERIIAVSAYLNKDFIEALIQKRSNELELQYIVKHGGRSEHLNFYVELFNKYVPAAALKNIVSSVASKQAWVEKNALYEALRVIEEKKQLETLGSRHKAKVVKL